MVFISIGNTCAVKHQIDKHRHKIPTLFFDWLMTSMQAVIKILSCDDINKILFFDNIVRDIKNPFHEDKSRICIKSLVHCISIHDLDRNFTDDDIMDFINKYKIRFYRIIEYIKSNEKIYFIRNGAIDDTLRNKFIEAVLKINPNCDFTLIVVDNKEHEPSILKSVHCLYIKLNKVGPKDETWHYNYLNWETIFLEIEKNI
jgi:hypothetical protein